MAGFLSSISRKLTRRENESQRDTYTRRNAAPGIVLREGRGGRGMDEINCSAKPVPRSRATKGQGGLKSVSRAQNPDHRSSFLIWRMTEQKSCHGPWGEKL
jgi:hypothetical protein